MNIGWDKPKRLTNLDKHGVDFADIDEEFFAAAIAGPAKLGRRFAIGWLGDRPLIVFYLPMGSEALSIVSARKPFRRERVLLP